MVRIRILLVDDEKELLAATKVYLEKVDKNFQVITASSAKSALKLINTEPFDVIVSDYQMPNKNGLEFLEDLRSDNVDIPLIIFTGRGREEVAIQALNLGADYYLQKGGDIKSQFSELINLIKKTIEKRAADIAVRKSEEKFSKAFKYSFNIMFISRLADGSFLDINDKFTQLLNITRDDILLEQLNETSIWAKPDDYSVFKKSVNENVEVTDFETILLTKDSRLIPVLISATSIDIEGELCVLYAAQDISELTQALEALSENEQKYRVLFEESPIALINLNLFDIKVMIDDFKSLSKAEILNTLAKNPKIINEVLPLIKLNEINNKAIDLIGANSKEDAEEVFSYSFVVKNQKLFYTILEFLMNGELFFEGEFTVRDLKDKEYNILVRLTYAPGTEETWSKLLISMIDISKRKRAQEDLHRERKAFSIIAEAAISSNDVNDLCEKILLGLTETLGFEIGSIRLHDSKTNRFVPQTTCGMNEAEIKEIQSLDATDNQHKLVARIKEKQIIFIPDTSKSEMIKDSKIIKLLKAKSYIFCPLLDGNNRILGSIQLGSKTKKEIPDENKLFFEIVADMFVSILERMLQK
ncbi:MAG: response regulator [Candidatus Heimdallarchaeota archaeon]